MPHSGEVGKVDDQQQSDADSQVRVYGVKPHKGETPRQIVDGFLEATTSDEAEYDTAREYLTPALSKHWRQWSSHLTVLSSGPGGSEQQGGPGAADDDPHAKQTTVTLSGRQIAAVDAAHAYLVERRDFSTGVHLVKTGGEWRIDSLPDGLVLSEDDFYRNYQSVDLYYFAAPAPGDSPEVAARRHDALVADPVYLRTRIDLLPATVNALLASPSGWLSPAVRTAVPQGTRAASVSLDDSQQDLTVRVALPGTGSGGHSRTGAATAEAFDRNCPRIAAQLFQTVQAVESSGLSSVTLQRPDGSTACELGRALANSEYAPSNLVGTTGRQFYIDDHHHLVSTTSSASTAARVKGPLGSNAQPALRSVAVRRDAEVAAAVRQDGRALYVAQLAPGATLGHAVLTSSAEKSSPGLSAPSWDGFGNLWIADRDSGDPRLLMLRGGTGTPVEVGVDGLDGQAIRAVRVSADGARIALLVGDGTTDSLQIGRIDYAGTADAPSVAVNGLHTVTPQLADVKAASWAGPTRLVVVGHENHGVEQIQYVDVDGSQEANPTLTGISAADSVAGTEDQSRPLLAEYDGTIYRLPPEGNWKQLTPKGTAPVYPG
jgi:two-component system sensor histidine kinase MtrB